MHLLYREIFLHKIKPGKTVIINTDNTIIDLNESIITSRKLYVDNTKDFITDTQFDIIIIENVIMTEELYDQVIIKVKKILKENGIIMFINNIYKNNIHKNFLWFLNINFECLDDIFTKLINYDLKIIDNYRLHTSSNFLLSTDIFLISCIVK